MGCDGGTIPRRDEMVKLKKKAEKVVDIVDIITGRYLDCFCRLTETPNWLPDGSTVL